MQRLSGNTIIDPSIGFHYAFVRSPKLSSEPHCHDFYEIFITFGHPVVHVVNGTKQKLHEGSLVFIRPDDTHCYERPDGDCHIMNVAFSSALFEALVGYLAPHDLSKHLLAGQLPPVAKLHALDLSSLKTRFEWLAMSPSHPHIDVQLEFKMFLMDILVKHFRTLPKHPSQMPDWLSRLKSLMQQKEYFSAGMPKLFELSGKNREYVCRSFQKYFGQTPTQWLNALKLQYAANLLQYTDLDIVDVALDSGFDNLSHFYHLFKEQYRISPAKYRKSMTKAIIPE